MLILPHKTLLNTTHLKRKELFFIQLSLLVSSLLCAGKFAAWYMTHSLVILSDALESIINIVASAFAWYSIYLSNKPRDTEHPYGHGKIEFFSIGFEGAMILIAGIGIVIQAVLFFIYPSSLHQIGLGLWLTLAGGVANFLLGYYVMYNGKKLNSLTLTGNGKHILSDSYTSLGVFIALILILFTGYNWIDPIASVIAALIIIYTGFQLVRKSVRGLMDEVDMKVVDELAEILNKHRTAVWIDMHNMRVQRFGNFYHVDCHVTLPYYLSLEEVHLQIKSIEELVNMNFKKGTIEFFIHTDPCVESSCLHCMLADCSVRRKPFIKRIDWSKENLLPNKKHEFTE